ncbi:Metallothionein expression activator [Tolypocladium paradoxum]|uniref:Metallothionein expression activator n=1 Tax=Tolypocladium paradoxum TaxID=94208 RepID=A0A2S4LA20_9HYPO|nr:Metallothionein expression activator [Tolypocladium paradoxum]
MLMSKPTGNLHPNPRQHHRQNSTPSAFEGVKVPALSNANHRQAAGHHRGLSLDTRRQQTASPTTQQDYEHHFLREAQQQCIQARPGTHQQLHYVALARRDSENYLISPHDTPQAHRFNPSSCYDTSAVPFNPYGAQLNLMMQKNRESYASNMTEIKEFELYNDSALSTPTFMNFPESPSGQVWSLEGDSRRNSRRISNGIMDRVNKFENLSMEELQRPMTPPNQNGNNYLPPTPMETPHDRLVKQEARPERFNEDFDESMEETIKPHRNRSNQCAQNLFQEMQQQSEGSSAVPSPPRSSTLPIAKPFRGMQLQTPDFMSMNDLRHEFVKLDPGCDGLQHESDALHSASGLSHCSTPDTRNMGQFIRSLGDNPDLHHVHNTPHSAGGPGSEAPSRRASPHHRRTESVASIASAASIASINIEETKTETGVTMEEIAQYIRGPETTDGKWTCLFDDCGKQFGRKENIKSHVQTHLNDRQYQCPTCHKCFVRQHDLKRHAKIHTGIKPYPCECGNSFARHDALTRHRQRGMCIGAFDGIVRKVVKRGRPRKNRPDMDTRMEKSARQRKKNMSISSVSSVSAYSEGSAVNSPENNLKMLDDIVGVGIESQGRRGVSLSSAAMPTLMTARPVAEVAPSPSGASVHSYVSPEAIMETTFSNPATPAKSIASHCTPPPELSQSSSPPATRFFDMDPNTSAGADELAAMPSATMPIGINDQDEDLLLQFTNDDGLVQLDRDPGMLMMSKFDEEFDNVGMFSNDDMFFGSA